jgi:glycosyltransferase involved in cell wall biosynthesis
VAEPLVSVITPTHNHARFIGRQIESLLAQDYDNWEQIIVDDGSTDDTQQVVAGYRDPRISYVYQENLGVRQLATTLNRGLERTRGELVTMLPSDDLWPPDRLALQVPVFADSRVVLCHGWGEVIDENDRAIGGVHPDIPTDRLDNRPVGSALHELLVRHYILQTTVLIRRSALAAVGGYLQPDGLFAEDFPTHLALALQGEFRFVDRCLGRYRMHPAQMTQNHHLAMIETDLEFARDFLRSLTPEQRALSGWTEATLDHELRESRLAGYVWAGRRDLMRRDWSSARRNFSRSLRSTRPRTIAKGMLGLSFSLLKRDVESVARVAGRPPLR